MAHAIRIHENGGPEVLRYDEIPVGEPGPGEARVRITAAGVNFVDVYHRAGLYPMQLPAALGVEAAGTVERVGPGVTGLAPGDRVAYAGSPGCYADARVLPAERLVKLPDESSDVTAGGVGLIAVQWLKALGATVIGTVGSDEKAALARAHGCDHVVVYTREDFVKRVRELTGGEGVPVVYDAVGKTTFDGSLDCLRPLGM